MPAQPQASTYGIDQVKTFNSPDGGGFQARLLRDGQPVAQVFDAGHGGPLQFDWQDAKAPRVPITHTPPGQGPVTYVGTPEEARLQAHVETLPPFTVPGLDRSLPMTADVFIGELVNTHMELKSWRTKLTRWFKTQVCTLEGDDLYTHKVAPSAAAFQAVSQRHPQRTVLNTLPIEEAARLVVNTARRKDGLAELPPETAATPARTPRRRGP